ncbi:hypothetical protein N0V95_008017 [Ascochyta clinopodiicola]|nr:hypothetical protein N0V95_008017 [Ascochyta clinopodiicola]
MFLEWMYWGSYNAPDGLFALERGHDIDAWILGDKLEAAGFQNIAMNRSPLRLFLLDVLAQNFTNTECVKGTLEDWDMALQEYPDARLLLLAGFRTYDSSCSSVKAEKNYLVDSKEVHSIKDPQSATQLGTVISAGSSHGNGQTSHKVKSEIKEELRDD